MIETLYTPEATLPIDHDAQVQHVIDWAEPKHTDEAEYHHFPHSLGAYEISMKLADQVEAEGIKVNRRALAFAAICHDIYVHLPLDYDLIPGMKFESKEHRSATLTQLYLLSQGYDDETVALPAYNQIMSTKKGEPCLTVEDVILRMADIFNTSGEFEVFEERSWAFYRETCKLDNKTLSFEEWLPGAMDFLEGFLDSALPAWFIEDVQRNIKEIRQKYQKA